jgi:hypothetical protein
MRRNRLVFGLVALTTFGLAAGVWHMKKGDVPKDTSDLALPSLGREAVLKVSWHETGTARLPKGESAGLSDTMPAELQLDADLVLSRETTTEGEDAVKAELRDVRDALRDVRDARVVVSSQEVLEKGEAGRKSLEKHPIHLVVADGRIVRVLVDKSAPSLAVQITENVARQVLLPRPKGKTFDRDEETPSGTMKVHYEPKANAGVDAMARNVTAAVKLEGLPDKCEGACVQTARSEGVVRFEDGSAIVSFSDKREITAGVPGKPAMYESKATFEATRVKEGDFDAPRLDPSALASKLPGESFENEAEKHAALVRRAEGATIEDVIGGISAVATGGSKSLGKGWLVRSTALLELHPELLAEVAVRFEDESVGTSGRVAILDLLASTNGDAAQAALLKVLDSGAAREGEERLAYVQRMVLVDEPNATTARAMRDRFATSRGGSDADMAYAEAHVLGSIAGRMSAHGMRGDAKASVDMIAKSVDEAKTPAARAAYLSALGNAGDPAQVSRIAKHANDTDPTVRRSVAAALRKTKDPAAKSTLLSLAKDPNEEVQVTALDSIAQQGLEPSDQRELTSLIDQSKLGAEAEGRAVTMLLRQGPPSPQLRASLEALLARTQDPRLAARIRLALDMT